LGESIEDHRDTRRSETGRGISLFIQDLIAEPKNAQTPSRRVAVGAVPRIHDNAQASTDDETAANAGREKFAVLVDQLNASRRDGRRDRVPKAGKP
jgi:hypothetical protein